MATLPPIAMTKTGNGSAPVEVAPLFDPEETPERNVVYLNRENRWLDFQSAGLDLGPDGAWRLAALPRPATILEGSALEEAKGWPEPEGPAGLGVDPCGAVYFSNPLTAVIGQEGPCEGSTGPGGGEGETPGRLRKPRGLLYSPDREALFVADAGNSRIQLLTPPGWGVAQVWGRAGRPGAAPWGLRAPVALASGPTGELFVVDMPNEDGPWTMPIPALPAGQPEASQEEQAGEDPMGVETWYSSQEAADQPNSIGTSPVAPMEGARVLKLDRYGRPEPGFWEQARRSAGLLWPVSVGVGPYRGSPHLFVLDAGLLAVVVLSLDGQGVDQFGSGELRRPLALAVGEGAVYVGDNGLRQVLVFKPGPPGRDVFRLVGPAAGYRGPVAALQAAPGPDGALWLHPGEGRSPVRFEAGGATARQGIAWGGPFGSGLRSVIWRQLSARVEGLGEGTHVRFFVHGGLDPGAPPATPALDAPIDEVVWQPLPLDVTDGLVPPAGTNGPTAPNLLPRAPYLWVAALLSGEGSGSPVLSQVRLTYDRPTYRQRLPAIFSRDPAQAALLDRLLALFESFNEEAEDSIRGLDRLFDPQASPAGWLRWLAGWTGLELDENWPESFQRQLIAQALALFARRGTPQGLRAALRLFAQTEAVIEEPVLAADWWSLAPLEGGQPMVQAASVLGFTTRLAPAGAEGAVLGISADLDRSSLVGEEEAGAALYREVAHQFTVSVYRGQAAPGQDLERVRAVIEREKPAHTVYALCVIEPQMRVGFQARLGIDTVVAGAPPPTPLDNPPGSAGGLVLGGDPTGQMGSSSEIGRSTRIG